MKRLMLLIFMLIHAAAISQVIVMTGLKSNLNYVCEIVSGDTIVRDSINTVLSRNNSYGVHGRLIYYVFESRNVQGEMSIAINTLRLPDEGPCLPMGIRGIRESDFPLLFQYGIKLKATCDGFLLTLDRSGISSLTFRYEDYRFENFINFLNYLSDYLDG